MPGLRAHVAERQRGEPADVVVVPRQHDHDVALPKRGAVSDCRCRVLREMYRTGVSASAARVREQLRRERPRGGAARAGARKQQRGAER